jgi:hypothetical protein
MGYAMADQLEADEEGKWYDSYRSRWAAQSFVLAASDEREQKSKIEARDMSDLANLSSLYDLIGKIGAPNVRGVKMRPDTCKHLRGAGHIQRTPGGGTPSNDDKDVFTFQGKPVTLSEQLEEDTFELILTK